MEKSDPKILELSAQMKEMLQTRKFDNLMGLKIPHLKHGVMNLLKVVDLSKEDQIELIKMGYGDLLHNPSAQMRSQDRNKEAINMQLEEMDDLQSNQITFKFLVVKPSIHASPLSMPKRLYFQMRFFTFPEVHTDSVRLF